eukprot:UN05560
MVNMKLIKMEEKEKELDRDAEMIATQADELRKESERLLKEREEVRKQKEQWEAMIVTVKEQHNKTGKRENELKANHKKLLELHETLQEEKRKLHRKNQKIKAREKRLNALRNRNAQIQPVQPIVDLGSDYAESELTFFSDGGTEIASVNSSSDDEQKPHHIDPKPVSFNLNEFMEQEYAKENKVINGSDYAESEMTYFSDQGTELASVNSVSDDDSQDNY